MWAALFPGQGSQVPGMGRFLWDEFKIVRETFEEASDALGLKMSDLCFKSTEADLAMTENTQPCLTLVSVATARVLHSELGFKPNYVAGHSVGEFAAIVTAGAMSFADAMRAVRIRGEAMQSAVPLGQGGMIAIMGLEPAQVVSLCNWAQTRTGDGPVEPANLNAPGQIVISGKKTILDWIAVNFKPEVIDHVGRVKFIALKVSAPFHCALMNPARDVMHEFLGEVQFADAAMPVVQNVNAEPVVKAAELRANLVAQVSAPVRWIESVQNLKNLGVERTIESGTGRVLTGLVKKIDGQLRTHNVNSIDDIRQLETELKGSI